MSVAPIAEQEWTVIQMADEFIKLDTTIIGIDSLVNKASTVEEANVLFTVKSVIYSQQRYFTDVQPVNRWISIKEKLPPEDESVLIYTIMGMCVAARWNDRFFVSKTASFAKYDVTHWMPLPEPPKDGEQNG